MSTANRFVLFAILAFAGLPALGGCVYQPLYGANSYAPEANTLASVSVADVDTRVGQQVRNHLIFLLQGGRDAPEARYQVKLRVTDYTQLYASNRNVGSTTAGSTSVMVSYSLVDLTTGKQVATGSRQTNANYDRTGQSFANERAELDAQNRAAREMAEQIYLALAANLSST